jgi:hypothetical protein
MTANERADAIIKDILVNHLPRVREGLEKGYVDENQILVMYDHAVRARILKEVGAGPGLEVASLNEHEDALSRINSELEAEDAGREAFVQANLQHPLWKAAVEKEKAKEQLYIVLARSEYNQTATYVTGVSTPLERQNLLHGLDRRYAVAMPLAMADEVMRVLSKVADISVYKEIAPPECKRYDEFHVEHKDTYECPCGGHVKEKPAYPESLLECEQCAAVYLDEDEIMEARKAARPDAIFAQTGTNTPDGPKIMETEILLNGKRQMVKGDTITYEQIILLLKPDATMDMLSKLPVYTIACDNTHLGYVGCHVYPEGPAVKIYAGTRITAVVTNRA